MCPLASPAQSASTPKALLVRNRIRRAQTATRRQRRRVAFSEGGDDGASLGAVNVDTILYAPGMEVRVTRPRPSPRAFAAAVAAAAPPAPASRNSRPHAPLL